jgi:protein-S-isoprenylcysteine O-methyltransferase Ste14
MDATVNLLIIALMMFCAIGYFLAGLAMLVTRPPRIDGQTGEPSSLWRAVTYTMFVLSLVNVASSFVAHKDAADSWWLVVGRVLMSTALIAVLIALHRRHRAQRREH